MSTITQIKQVILELPDDEYAELRNWLLELDWERWDREIEEDSAAGKLDFLAAEALAAKENGTLTEL